MKTLTLIVLLLSYLSCSTEKPYDNTDDNLTGEVIAKKDSVLSNDVHIYVLKVFIAKPKITISIQVDTATYNSTYLSDEVTDIHITHNN